MSWYELAPAQHWKRVGMAITFHEVCYMPGTVWDILHILSSLILLLNAEGQGQTSPTINSFLERYPYGWIYFYIFFLQLWKVYLSFLLWTIRNSRKWKLRRTNGVLWIFSGLWPSSFYSLLWEQSLDSLGNHVCSPNDLSVKVSFLPLALT